MKKILIIFGLLFAFSLQQTVLISSAVDNTIITAPANYHPVLEAYHTKNNPNYIGYSAQWIYKNGSDAWRDGDTATFYATFYATCQSNAILVITADNTFSASFNNGTAYTGDNWQNIYRFNVSNLLCGVNTLTITVVNKDASSPAALIFALIQDQTKCFICASGLSFFNKKTCKCQCLDQCSCPTLHSLWNDYPLCGCRCSQNQTVKCPDYQYFNEGTCACQCNPIACLPDYVQSPTTCLCVEKCPRKACPRFKIWDPKSCECVCRIVRRCNRFTQWNDEYCYCEPIDINLATNP